MKNEEIRKAIKDAGVKHYELAEAMGIHACTLSHWLEHDLTEEKKTVILQTLQEIK